MQSLPTRERGLKLNHFGNTTKDQFVAPHAGAWIETAYLSTIFILFAVAPHAGAWIETPLNSRLHKKSVRSLPTRERGLKQFHNIKRGI